MKDGVGQRGSTFTAYWWIKDPDKPGEYVQRSRGGFKNKTEAKNYRTGQMAALNAGTYSEPKDKTLTVKAFLTDHWLPAARTEATRSGAPRRESTIGTYETVVDKWLVPHIGGDRVAALTPKGVEAGLTELREHGGKNGRALGGRSVQVAHGVLRQALDYGLRHGYVQRNVAAEVRRPGAKAAVMSAWTVDEARAFLTAVKDDRLYAAWLLLLSRGPRRGELAGLRWADVDFDAKVAKIAVTRVAVGGKTRASTPKTAAGTRSLSLDASLVTVLKDHRKRQLRGADGVGRRVDRLRPGVRPRRRRAALSRIDQPAVRASL